MRHGKKFNHLGRKKAHRAALLSNMAASLILHKRINTTLAKAKALRVYVEPLVTKAKTNTTHARRTVFSYMENKEAIQELFGPVREKIGGRPGGYVRVIRTGTRPGDGAETAMIEFVDFNQDYVGGTDTKAATTQKRKTRRGKSKTVATTEKPAETGSVADDTNEEN
ncbi:MAG TPA: 50S ribosomal protein L17 [Saprospiraceae bacterium]|nr:50S ribosomal protein L17 [Saprospiraceae bacterium]